MTDNYVVGARKSDLDILRNRDKVEIKTTKQFLQHTKVSSLFPPNRTQIVSVDGKDSVGHAFQLLVKNKILSMPVYDEKLRNYVRFIDVLDIVVHVLHHNDVEKLKTWTGDLLAKQIDTSDIFTKYNCSKVAALSGRNPYYAIDENAPLLVAMELISRHKLHRIPVVDKQGELITVISQSHVIKLIDQNLTRFDIRNSTVGELGLGLKKVFSVKESEWAIEAFKKIVEQKISGIAVVDDEGRLIGNISASDVQHIGYETYLIAPLLVPSGTFIKNISKHQHSGPVTVSSDTLIGELISQFAELGIHRIYVVDEKKAPIGVISLVDLIDAIVKSVK